LEALFARAREGSFRINQAAVDVIHDALDCSEDLLANLNGERPAPNTARILEAIDVLLTGRPRDELPAQGGDGHQQPEKPVAAGQEEFAVAHPGAGEENAVTGTVDGDETSPSEASVRLRASHVDRLLRTCDQLTTAGLSTGL